MHLVQFKFIYMEPVVSRQFIFQGKDPKLLKRKPQQSHYFKLVNTDYRTEELPFNMIKPSIYHQVGAEKRREIRRE